MIRKWERWTKGEGRREDESKKKGIRGRAIMIQGEMGWEEEELRERVRVLLQGGGKGG
jgi:hypothetical protein